MKKTIVLLMLSVLITGILAAALELTEPDRPKVEPQKFCGFIWGDWGEEGCFCPPSMERHRWMLWQKCEKKNGEVPTRK